VDFLFSFDGCERVNQSNVQVRKHALSTFIINPLVGIHQEKMSLKIAAKIASVNGPLESKIRGPYSVGAICPLSPAALTATT
jgi:hypothetical protein